MNFNGKLIKFHFGVYCRKIIKIQDKVRSIFLCDFYIYIELCVSKELHFYYTRFGGIGFLRI